MKQIQLFVFYAEPFWALESYAQKGTDTTDYKYPYDSTKMAYASADDLPEFPGGTEAMINFLDKNTQYPKEALEKGISGRLVVTFVVGIDGKISNIEIINSLDPNLDREAVRVVSKFPSWIPGKIKGKMVPAMYALPISFSLN